jgi:Pentapeptide repeats (8 copies)
MADPVHLEILFEGVERWNEWRVANPDIKPDLRRASLVGGTFNNVDLREAIMIRAQLSGAMLNEARLEGANLDSANLEGARLREAHLEGATLKEANLGGADLRGIFLSKTTKLEDAQLFSSKLGSVSLVDTDWGHVNLGTVHWDDVKIIGDETMARALKDKEHYQAAQRCYRQLSMELRRQGLGEEADRFAYRGQRLHRILLRRQKKWYAYIFSCGLDFLVGYGYKPGRSLVAYLTTLVIFAAFYASVPNVGAIRADSPTPLSLANAILFSLISFHGRVNAPSTLSFNGLYAWISILETIVGLIIELSFIAAFTQRFLGGKS